jgi:hypothetical protein
MSWQAVTQASGSTSSGLFEDGFGWQSVLIGVLAVLALIAVCTFGILARLRDRASDRRSLAALHRTAQPVDDGPDQRRDTGGSGPAAG